MVALLVALAAGTAARAETAGRAFGLEQVAEHARALAGRPYDDGPGKGVPDWLLELDYDRWRGIRYRPEEALWADAKLPFTVQFFHPGLFYDRTVAIHVVDAEGVRPVPFSPSRFDYGGTDIGSRVPQDLGYAGFRLHHPIKTKTYYDEVIVFLGASYFRAVGKGQTWGLSARGLAVDTALPRGEEFPRFRAFWILRPAPGDPAITVLALLDSPSTTGAYRFVVWPGEHTRVDVEAQLFARHGVEKLGLAPLTSMFLVGENSLQSFEDFRPEVHDSDGLLVATRNGEWIWRPLENPTQLSVSSFTVDGPKGFGLLQRDRDFDHYQDLESRFDLRPSAWVEPKGDWGPGRIELVEIPTRNDANDNVVVFWVPREPLALGSPFTLAYSLFWYGESDARPPGGRTFATHRGTHGLEDAQRFVVDFVGERLARLPEDAVLRAVVTVGRGSEEDTAHLLEQQVIRNPVTGGWRVVLRVRAADDRLPLRLFLQQGEDALTETWSYLLHP